MVEAAHRSDAPEQPGVRAGRVLAAVLGTFAAIAVAIAALWLVYRGAIGPDFKVTASRFPSPRLDTREAAHRRQYQDAARRKLASYGWVDRKAGLARIPIDQAMAIIAAHGASALDPLPGKVTSPAKPGGDGR